jgi:hypothetical protein
MTHKENPMVTLSKKRYLNDAACKASAVRLSKEMREDREGREKWGDMWLVYLNGKPGPKPASLVIPGEMEAGKATIENLYHPAEAAIIIANLTDGGQG